MGVPFKIRTTGRSLVVTFDQLCQVVSWAPLLGGFRSNVSHILFEEAEPGQTHELETALRRSSGRLGLKGTVVGMLVDADVSSQKVVNASNDEVQVSVLAMRRRYGATESSKPSEKSRDVFGFASMLLFANRRLSHEAMLEAMVLGVEARAKIGKLDEHRDESSELRTSLRGPEPVAIASNEDVKSRFGGDHEGLRKLILRVVAECLSE